MPPQLRGCLVMFSGFREIDEAQSLLALGCLGVACCFYVSAAKGILLVASANGGLNACNSPDPQALQKNKREPNDSQHQ